MAAVVRGLSQRAMAGPRRASAPAKVAARTSNPRPLMIPSRTFAAPPKMISRYVLQYKYTPDVLEKRDPYRAGHLDLIKEMAAEGHIMSAGAFADPVARLGVVFEGLRRWRQGRLNPVPQRRTVRCSSSRPAMPRSSSRSSTPTGRTSSLRRPCASGRRLNSPRPSIERANVCNTRSYIETAGSTGAKRRSAMKELEVVRPSPAPPWGRRRARRRRT